MISSTPHNHEANEAVTVATRKKQDMKGNASVNMGRPGQILADTLQTCTVEVRAALGNMNSVKRTIRRSKKGSVPKEPASLRESVVPQE